jgi:hypothetical protein
MRNVIALLSLGLLAGGCAGVATSPLTTSFLTTPGSGGLEIHNQTEVRMDRGNFFVVRTNVVGQSKGFALLGLFTMVPPRFSAAMDRLYAGAKIEAGKPQTTVNLVMEKSSLYFILFSIPRVTVRADIVEFVPALRTPEGLSQTGPD